MVLVKKFKIFDLFLFGGKIDQENKFEDILERKKAFLDYKSKKLIKQIENFFFSKRPVYGFGQKTENFPCISFWQNRPGKCV